MRLKKVSAMAVTILLGTALSSTASPPQPASERQDRWRILGPGGGGAQFSPEISPHDPDTVLVACDMTGAYITTDAGRTWRMFNLRGRVRFFAFDPVDPNILYAQSVGLFRSRDRGKTWELVFPDPDQVRGLDSRGDHARDVLLADSGIHPAVHALAVDPSRSQVLYAAIETNGSLSLFVSDDWGKTWQVVAKLPDGALKIYVDPRTPPQNRVLYIVGNRGVSRYEGGQLLEYLRALKSGRFSGVSGGFPTDGSPPVFYGVVDRQGRSGENPGAGIYISRDGGASWNSSAHIGKQAFQGEAPRLVAVATCLNRPETAYVSFRDLRTENTPHSFFGVAKTGDAGNTWSLPLLDSTDQPSSRMRESWISRRFGRGWGESPFSLAVSPTDPDICYGTDWGRTMRTLDGLETWEPVYSRDVGNGGNATIGLDVTTAYGVHFDPFDPRRLFISYTDIGLFRSEDGGNSWKSSTDRGVPRGWVNTTYWMVFDPEVRGRIWAVASGIHDLPRPKMWRDQPVERYNGGILYSEDGGISWVATTEGLPETAATHILLDPASSAQSRTLYVTGFGRGVFKSMNGGKSWQLKNRGLPGSQPFAWRLTLDPDGALYLVIARRSVDGDYGNAEDGALYRSEDGADSWQEIPLPQGVNGPVGLSVDPENPKRFYLAAWGRNVNEPEKSGGVYVSEDRGGSWRRTLQEDQHVYDITVDSRRPNILYATGFESSAWRSADRGETWDRIRGYNFKWGHRVIPDPQDPEMIYITTFGGSVWHGPAVGDPSAVEDIVTPVVAY